MKVLLSQDVDNLGYRGDIVSVAPGYARNYLLPKRMAVEATPGNLKQLDLKRKHWADLEARDAEVAGGVAARIAELELKVEKKAGERATLYGSVTSSEIAELLAAHGIEVDRRKIQLREPIKSLGFHTVAVKLHREVVGEITIEVVAEDAPAEEAGEAAPEAEPSAETSGGTADEPAPDTATGIADETEA